MARKKLERLVSLAGQVLSVGHASAAVGNSPAREPYSTTTALLRWARYGFLAAGLVFLLWEMAAVFLRGHGLHLETVVAVGFVSVLGPLAVWFTAQWAERVAAQDGRRFRELLAVNTMVQQVLAERWQLQGDLVKTRAHLHLLERIAGLMAQLQAPEELADRIVDALLEVMRLDAGEIWLMSPSGEALELWGHRGLSPEAFRELTRFALGEGFPGIAAQTKEPLFTSDLRYDPRFLRSRVVEAGFTFFGALPILAGGGVLGVLTVASRRSPPPTPHERHMLASVANSLAPLLRELPQGSKKAAANFSLPSVTVGS